MALPAEALAEGPGRSLGLGERLREPRLPWIAAGVLGVSALLALPLLAVHLLREGAGLLVTPAGSTLVTSATWSPSAGLFGLLPLVAGTLATSLLGLALAVPLGLGAALWLHFFAPRAFRRSGDTVLGILAGTPSVVFGLFGTVWLVPRLGPSLLSAGLVLAAMVLPTFCLLALAALRQIPSSLLASGAALGLRREQVISRLALVVARPRLLAAISLSLARCLGEALAVEMVCGNVAGFPTHLTDAVRTLTTTLVQEFDYAAGAHHEALHLVALAVCLLAVVASSLATRLLGNRALLGRTVPLRGDGGDA